MENLSDVQLKRCVAWMRLELLAWICLCADALVSVWAPSVWDTGHIYGLFVVVVLVSGLAAVVLSWVRNPMRWNLTGLGRRFFWGSHGSCMALSVILVFWVPELSIGILFVWNSIYMLVAYERELRRRKKKEES
ncbi:hypothetical protein [Anaerotignum sp.]|uniref:hypothetical protein n=1 Tax=Anaerotignum sp. TaxID=2039241 RepID=UPI0029DD271B|nr:hypothetical protein [Anaerotignum sp.]MCI6056236.1 hypothetical protein [Clostridia bacterium]MDY3595305.1 hypothetical protein [Anaerotignum sp.]